MTKQKDWEKEIRNIFFDFEKALVDVGVEIGDIDYDNLSTVRQASWDRVKDLLSQQKKEVVEMIENKKSIISSKKPTKNFTSLINSSQIKALDDLLDLLNKE